MFCEDDALEERGPEEDDLLTEDLLRFYRAGRRVVTLQVRQPPRYVGERGTRTRDAKPGEMSPAAMWRQLDRWMKQNRCTPSVWFMDDHGNSILMRRPRRKPTRKAR